MHRSRATNRSGRSAFTLIELLVVITILTILVSITAASMSWTADKDRLPQAANEVSSFIMGARDRAIYRRSPTGVRLILDQNGPTNSAGNPITVSSLMYIGSPPSFSGQVSIEFDPDADTAYPFTPHHLRKLRFWSPGTANSVPGIAGDDGADDRTPDVLLPGAPGDDTGEFRSGTDDVPMDGSVDPALNSFNDFERYFNLGLLDTGNQITLSKGGSLGLNFTLVRWATPSTHPDTVSSPGGYDWFLSADFPSANLANCMDLEFTIDLRPAILPDQEPRELPRGVVIDLEASRRQGRLPTGWYDTDSSSPTYQSYRTDMDILFSPRGTGTGEWSGFGLLHLLITEAADVERTEYDVAPPATPPPHRFYKLNQTPEQRPNAGQERVVTVNPSSGRASVSALLLDDGNADNIPDDPFQHAERGKTAR